MLLLYYMNNTVAQCLSLAVGRGVEVRVLVPDPGQEPGDLGIGRERAQVIANSPQLRVGKARMQRPVADRVDAYSLPSTAALWHRMMPLRSRAERARAKPA